MSQTFRTAPHGTFGHLFSLLTKTLHESTFRSIYLIDSTIASVLMPAPLSPSACTTPVAGNPSELRDNETTSTCLVSRNTLSFRIALPRIRENQVPRERWPQTAHWNWELKSKQIAGLLALCGFALSAQGVTQGLMRIDLNHSARHSEQVGKPLVYVEYLEVALIVISP